MDNQLALMKKLQKDPDTIAYAHNEEIVLIKRVVNDDGVRLTEVTLNPQNGSKISERVIENTEMKLSDFDTIKQLLTEETRQEFNADWSATKLNVDFDILEKTDLFSVQSVEDDYIESLDAEVEDYRTLDNAMKVLDSCLTKIQKKRYILSRAKGLSTREIAEKEGVSQRTVQDSLELAERKMKIFRKTPKNTSQNPQKNYISERTKRRGLSRRQKLEVYNDSKTRRSLFRRSRSGGRLGAGRFPSGRDYSERHRQHVLDNNNSRPDDQHAAFKNADPCRY